MEKRGLGRGLSALIPEIAEDATSNVMEIPVSQIQRNPYQPRSIFDPLKMEDLVASVKEHGILQPILVKKVGIERYELVAGERRYRAAKAAGLARIPALVRQVTEQAQLEIAIVENLQREDIGALESARAYKRLMEEFQMTQDQVAQRVGKSRSAVANTLRLLHLPEVVQQSLERSEITEGHARALLGITDSVELVKAWERVVKLRMSVRDTERLSRETKESPLALDTSLGTTGTGESILRTETRSPRDPNVAAVSEELQHFLGTKVTLRQFGGGSGRIEIDFYSAEELERIVDILLRS